MDMFREFCRTGVVQTLLGETGRQRPQLLADMGLLRFAGVASSCVAALHLLIIFWGGPGYRYFGAGERMVGLAEQGSPIPSVVTAGIAGVFAIWACYAFSGAGLLRRLPLLRPVLLLIGIVYSLRGVLLGPQLAWLLQGYRAAVPPRQLVFSLAALLAGLAYLEGTRRAWATLAAPERS